MLHSFSSCCSTFESWDCYSSANTGKLVHLYSVKKCLTKKVEHGLDIFTGPILRTMHTNVQMENECLLLKLSLYSFTIYVCFKIKLQKY